MRTEDDIKAAFRTLTRQAPDADAMLTAVREQLDNAGAGARQGAPRAARRWMTPLAAAAAVIAVTATAVAIANGQPTHHSGTSAGNSLRTRPERALRATKTPGLPGLVLKRLKGLEPSTFCMASRRSSQLSYSRA